ncbi:scaffolding protein SbcC-like protein [Agrilactobacillus composti DSM 18527 = JCM 14202]|uniref:Scaffolding protein SbcC-like protein n=1 Tax=Agrilactobacillus composti DSM 18527 = JCM 14202 TaxID=1423734 RepID=X0PGG7_9LACO|nr:phage scaffolding protein [Agrilactobacillus composti]KRM35616.1 scaffolding protein SbcC-like protein [Agrilactobacillus composti DSM 18527 = JCM 14202]GAF41134.1 phage capsid scaffolding protein [Agrilactobacillus composti DSM 18527 = JCM 14202]
MKREALQKLELSDEQIDKIMAMNGADIEKTKSSAGDVEAIKQENESLKTQIADRDKDLKSLKKQAGDNEDLTQKYSDLESKYKADTEELTHQLQETKLNSALDTVLGGAKVRNPKAAKALLDMDKVKLNDKGELEGVTDQIDALKKSDAYLFDEGTKTGYNPKGGDGSNDNDEVQTLVDAFKN